MNIKQLFVDLYYYPSEWCKRQSLESLEIAYALKNDGLDDLADISIALHEFWYELHKAFPNR